VSRFESLAHTHNAGRAGGLDSALEAGWVTSGQGIGFSGPHTTVYMLCWECLPEAGRSLQVQCCWVGYATCIPCSQADCADDRMLAPGALLAVLFHISHAVGLVVRR